MSELPTLWSITQEETDMLALLEQAEDEDVREAALERLETIVAQHYQKVDRIEFVFRQLERREGALAGEIEAVKAELGALQRRLTARENNIARLKEYVVRCMERAGVNELEGDTVKFRLQPGRPAVEIIDEDAIPTEYRKPPEPTAPLKALIGAALKAGRDVPGARLREGGNTLRRA